jgi:hypothetical protein
LLVASNLVLLLLLLLLVVVSVNELTGPVALLTRQNNSQLQLHCISLIPSHYYTF